MYDGLPTVNGHDYVLKNGNIIKRVEVKFEKNGEDFIEYFLLYCLENNFRHKMKMNRMATIRSQTIYDVYCKDSEMKEMEAWLLKTYRDFAYYNKILGNYLYEDEKGDSKF